MFVVTIHTMRNRVMNSRSLSSSLFLVEKEVFRSKFDENRDGDLKTHEQDLTHFVKWHVPIEGLIKLRLELNDS